MNERGTSLRGARFSDSNLAGILARETYTGTYRDRTADDGGITPEIENAITVTCPAVIDRPQSKRVAALRAIRNPRKTAPHRQGGRYACYTCDARVNRSSSCACPSIRREQLDGVVWDLVERELLSKDRLRALLSGVVELSDQNAPRVRANSPRHVPSRPGFAPPSTAC